MMNVSFGIEFEFDIIKSDGTKIRHEYPPGRYCIRGWDYQCDSTCAVELRSPVFVSVDQAVNEIRRQFNKWCEVLDGCAPYAFNTPGRSLGMHIHVGLPDASLFVHEKRAIGRAVANVYPFLASLQAQPIPSLRGLTTTYARPIWRYNWNFPSTDHYCEISSSAHGTVEFRLFDSNIPQIALVNAFFLKAIAEKVLDSLSDNNNLSIRLMKRKYMRDRDLGLRYGINALGIRSYLRYLLNLIGDIELPNYDFFREILYLAIKYGITPYGILRLSGVNEYHYFKEMFCNPDKFIQNIYSLMNVRDNEQFLRAIDDALENAHKIARLSDLIALSAKRRVEIMATITIPEHSRDLPSRSYVRKCIESNNFRIARIFEVSNMSEDEVADRISYLLRYHGNRFVNVLSPHEIINDSRRFYVMTVHDPENDREVIIASIAIRVRTGEVSSLVVDKRYRRLGIARRLIEYVKAISERPIFGYVRANNQAMISLLRSLGFSLREVDDRVLLFHLPGDDPLMRGD